MDSEHDEPDRLRSNPIPADEFDEVVHTLFGRSVQFLEPEVAPSEWLGGVLVSFKSKQATLTMHHPDRRILSYNDYDIDGTVGERLDPFAAAALALRRVSDIFPWSAELHRTLPEEAAVGCFRMSLIDRRGPAVFPTRVDLGFYADGRVSNLWSYREADVPIPEVLVSREEAIDVAENVARERPEIFLGCRYEGAELRVRRIKGEFRVAWLVAYPPAALRPGVSDCLRGPGGTIEVDAQTGELVDVGFYK